jgi:hypothetical protein
MDTQMVLMDTQVVLVDTQVVLVDTQVVLISIHRKIELTKEEVTVLPY